MTYIGIDISKATFVAAFPVERGYRTETFQNDAKGIRRFISKLSSDTHHCVMEATGNYCFLLLYLLPDFVTQKTRILQLIDKHS
ncbi:transposase [Hallella sp.]|uniref:transposase n=1 Tax=Hallella sp. TaxID=2980186 RepID=UPI00307CA963